MDRSEVEGSNEEAGGQGGEGRGWGGGLIEVVLSTASSPMTATIRDTEEAEPPPPPGTLTSNNGEVDLWRKRALEAERRLLEERERSKFAAAMAALAISPHLPENPTLFVSIMLRLTFCAIKSIAWSAAFPKNGNETFDLVPHQPPPSYLPSPPNPHSRHLLPSDIPPDINVDEICMICDEIRNLSCHIASAGRMSATHSTAGWNTDVSTLGTRTWGWRRKAR